MPDPTAAFECPNLHVRVRTTADTVVVTAAGEIDLATSPLLATVFAGAVAAGCRRVVLDAHGVSFMDASGLRPLVELEREGGPGAARVRNPTPAVTRLLEVAGRVDLVEQTEPGGSSALAGQERGLRLVDPPLMSAAS